MSYEKFITDLLNIKLSELQSVTPITQKDGTYVIKVRLIPKKYYCPNCNIPGKIHSYYKRKLTHSTLANRVCSIYYESRRYICSECEMTFMGE